MGVVPGSASGTGDVFAGSTKITDVNTTSGSFNTGNGGAGKIISGAGIPPNDEIASVSSTEITLNEPALASGTAVGLTTSSGPGNIPTNDVQAVRVSATVGEFSLTFRSPEPNTPSSQTTNELPYNASPHEVQVALESLSSIGSGNVIVTGGVGDEKGTTPYRVEFLGRFADTSVRQLSGTNPSLSGGSPSSEVSVSTPQEGGGVVETCTTVCVEADSEEGTAASGNGDGEGPQPGRINYGDAIAIDNNSTSGSYGDVYVVDEREFRIQKFGPKGELLLLFGGEVNKTKVTEREEEEANAETVTITEAEENVCTAADLAAGETCGAGVPGTGPSHFYEENPPTGGEGSFAILDWSNEETNAIAVGPSGTVYVGDYGRIQEFNPDGTFAGEFVLPGKPQFVSALAIDSAGNLYERSYTTYRNGASPTEVPGVREFSPAHTLLRTFDTEDESEPDQIGLDGTGDLFVAEGKGSHFEFKAFKPDGSLNAVFGSEEIQVCEECKGIHGMAISEAAGGELYATSQSPEGPRIAIVSLPHSGPATISSQEANDIEPTTSTLHAVINPRGFDTHYHFEYVDQKSFETEGGFSSPKVKTTASEDLGLVNKTDPVRASISGLTSGTTYHWRAVAESSEGTTYGPSELTTLAAITVRDFTTQTVGPERVSLKAELNPNGEESSFTIEIGKTTNYESGAYHGTLGVGNELVPVEASFTGLQPNTSYHYKLTAENLYGEVESADATFRTELSVAEYRAAEDCDNQNLREQNDSLNLPDCRAYEQITPEEKEGGEAFPKFSLSPDGERVQFYSQGAFSGASANELATEYVAHRSSTGWTSQAVIHRPALPGFEPLPADFETGFYSANLERWLYTAIPAYSGEQGRSTAESAHYVLGSDEGPYVDPWTPTLELVEGPPDSHFDFTEIVGQSEDLSRLFIPTGRRLLRSPEDERPDNTNSGFTNHTRMYEIEGAGGPDPSMHLFAEVPLGFTEGRGSCTLDAEDTFPRSSRRTSSDGETVIYTDPVEVAPAAGCGEGDPNPIGLFARIDDGSPIRLDVPSPSQCTGSAPCEKSRAALPRFYGMSPDGHFVWFTTKRSLINSDTDASEDVYLAKLENGTLTELVQASAGEATSSHPNPGEGAGVKGIARVSADGTHVAYVASGVLTEHPNGLNQSAQPGADNLYVYDATSGGTTFVTDLCSGPEASGAVADTKCPAEKGSGENDSGIWNQEATRGGEIVFTPSGEYLLFDSWGRLASGDTDAARDVYRFDVSSGELKRVSFGRDGNDGNGNDDRFPANISKVGEDGPEPFRLAEDEGRAISVDGSIVIFETSAPLVSQDTNEAPDVYEWEENGHGTCSEPEGCISLVSSGVSPRGVEFGIISSSGSDIAFETQQSLVPGDTDGVGDVYDARIDGGFQPSHPPSACESPESCRAPSKPVSAGPTVATETFVGLPNGPAHLTCAKGRHRVTKHGQTRCVPNHHRPHSKRRHHHDKIKKAHHGARRGR